MSTKTGSNNKSKTSAKSKLLPIKNDMPEQTRSRVVEFLNDVLASTSDLYSQLKQAHWNVKGKDFYQLHLLFDEIATEVDGYIDEVAERITALGGTALGTVRMAAAHSLLPEYPVDAVNGKAHLTALTDRLAMYGKLVREGIDSTDEWGDKDTADLLTGISRTTDMRLWFIQSHLIEG